MSPDKLGPACASLLRVAEPPGLAIVFVRECGRVVFREQVVEPSASVGVAFAGESDVGCSGAGGGMRPDKLRLAGPSLLRVAQPSTLAMVFVSECGRVVFRKQVVEPLASVGVAFAGESDVGCSGAGGGMRPDKLRLAGPSLLRVAQPLAPALVAFIAELGLVAFRDRGLEQLASAGVALAGDCEPVPMVNVRKRVGA